MCLRGDSSCWRCSCSSLKDRNYLLGGLVVDGTGWGKGQAASKEAGAGLRRIAVLPAPGNRFQDVTAKEQRHCVGIWQHHATNEVQKGG
mmetsp:Transcript_98744/g.307657  ORF Transcript_98744/g.307657 Transcript_98744/m.307657 type:complete len:89 (-) Transcript_98744:331-597(-)